MKGVIFRGFLSLVEETFGLEVADAIIEESDLASGGAYTSVGTYDHGEIVTMVGRLSEHTGVPVPDLVRTFGKYLFDHLAGAYPELVAQHDSSFSLLDAIERTVHTEVRKLYPDAELPFFDCTFDEAGRLVMLYRSSRPLADVAHGLIEGCAEHYHEELVIEREDIPHPDETRARFTVSKAA